MPFLMYTCIALGSGILSTQTKPAFEPFQAPKFERHQHSPILRGDSVNDEIPNATQLVPSSSFYW